MSAIISGDSPSVTFSDGTTQSTAFTTGAVNQTKLATGVAGTGPAFSAYANANQVISSGTWTKVAINTEEFDTASCYDTINYRFTPNVAGYYQVSGQATVSNSGTNGIVSVYKNGTIYKRGSMNQTNAFSYGNCLSALVYLNGTTDYIEIYTIHNLGANANLGFGSDACFFQAVLVRAA